MADIARQQRFRSLHAQGFFVLPNPWDVGSARQLAAMGFQALATTSSGAAWAAGLSDGDLPLDAALAHFRAMADATPLPLNADFENGFADDPADLAANVAAAVDTGVAGLSIEDRPRRSNGLYAFEHAIQRIRAARSAIDASGQQTLLVARTEGFLVGQPDLEHTIERLLAMDQAGADCLYAPGVHEAGAIARIVQAVAPKPVNVLLTQGMRLGDLAALGVRRASTGGALARAARDALRQAAEPLRAMLAPSGSIAP